MVTMPVQRGFEVTSPFGPRWGTTHWGTDFGLTGGSGGKPVFAVKDGTVTRAGAASGFGQWVTVDHPAANGGGETVYGHVIPEVRVGQKVREGQRIARINPDSRTNGGVAPHLHLEWHRYSWSPPGPNRLDPMTMLRGASWPGDPAPQAPAPPQRKAPAMNVLDWSPRFSFGKPRPTHQIKNIIIHVTVNAPGTPAENVANYQIRSQSGSYHELSDTTIKHLIENTDDWLTWSSGNYGNNIGLHRSFVLWGTETRVQWLQYDRMLREAAKRDAEWCRKYNIPPIKLSAADLRAGKKGFAGHLETGQAWGGTDHVDPGIGFPWDVYLGYVRDNLNPPKETPNVLTPNFFTDFIKGFIGPLISDAKDIRQQLTGGRDAGQYGGWSVSQLVDNASSKPGDYATVPEMLALVLTRQDELKAELAELKNIKEGR
ncbi:peptidoglycan DD-metalloendopeptidase family protein [Corynebacterium timonense]|uniref:Peptidase family M23 n=1 Tax=Corynebacterium timonense TaxID=441500 RepID=A0A1H1LPB5_9CORY|nr:peptidoglycan DD-metalloendopeptidase family protein [Corynebacterium timonense]SDR76142.1 Peptidase family M23 [Corynebacterium timonense]